MYTSVKVPTVMVERIQRVLKARGYRSVSEFVIESVRLRVDSILSVADEQVALSIIGSECECQVSSRIAHKALAGEPLTDQDTHFPVKGR